MIGHAPVGRTFKLDSGWTLMDDPSIAAKKEKERLEKAEKATNDKDNEERAAYQIGEEAKKLRLVPVDDQDGLEPGDKLYHLRSDFAFGHGNPDKVHIEIYTIKTLESRSFEDTSGRTWPYRSKGPNGFYKKR